MKKIKTKNKNKKEKSKKSFIIPSLVLIGVCSLALAGFSMVSANEANEFHGEWQGKRAEHGQMIFGKKVKMQEKIQTQLDKLVESGKITQEQADKKLEFLKKHFLKKHGFKRGFKELKGKSLQVQVAE